MSKTNLTVVPAWSMPIDCSAYQPILTFSPDDLMALDTLIAAREAGRRCWPAGTSHIRTLLAPIEAVLDLTQLAKRGRREVRRVMLYEMYHHRAPFWAWDREAWVEILQGNSPSFCGKYRKFGQYRQQLTLIAYLLCDFIDLHEVARYRRTSFADKIFGASLVEAAIERVMQQLSAWGYKPIRMQLAVATTLRTLLLFNRSPYLEDLTLEKLLAFRAQHLPEYLDGTFVSITRAFVALGILTQPFLYKGQAPQQAVPSTSHGEHLSHSAWEQFCIRWRATATLAPPTRRAMFQKLLQVGRWLTATHPNINTPDQWSREIAADFVAAVDRWKVGDWGADAKHLKDSILGKPLAPRTKAYILATVRSFFRDCQEWEWIPRRLDPIRCFKTPRSILAQIGPDPRIIQDDVWAKLLWAGLNLTSDDVPGTTWAGPGTHTPRDSWYPLELVQALVMVWLFSGLRSDEIRRLEVGCVRLQDEMDDVGTPLNEQSCWLNVPVGKTSTAFTKPVDVTVGDAIAAWEKVRPSQLPIPDRKTGILTHFLFSYRSRVIGGSYLNVSIIPMLCKKAGVPEEDARGRITSHRARSTIASQLANAKEPMSLLELKEWLGHRHPASTLQYVRVSPTRLTSSFQRAGYFERNLRTIEVLIDQDVVRSGAAAEGQPWRFYDLGHGYCSYDFFDQCPHRMACAKCAFYLPKESTKIQLLEAKSNLQRMLQEIPLTDDERAAVEDGIAAMEKFTTHLAGIPTPAGPTPQELGSSGYEVIPLTSL